MRIAICTFQYCFEISPLLKGLASYLIDKHHDVTLLTDGCNRGFDFRQPGMRITCSSDLDLHGPKSSPRTSHFWVRLIGMAGQPRRVSRKRVLKSYEAMIRESLCDFDLFIVCEETSLLCLLENSVAPSKIAVLLLEGLQAFQSFLKRKQELLRILRSCQVVTAASQVRADAFAKELGGALPVTILPVAIRQADMQRWCDTSHPGSDNPAEPEVLRLIHSGYFAPWAMVNEIVAAFPRSANCVLTLHGHKMGTEKFMAQVRESIHQNEMVRLDEGYYGDQSYVEMLSNQHCGIACYRPSNEPSGFDVSNWSDMIRSSGKIATYLWCSLPVITNIDLPETRSAPFIFLSELSRDALADAISQARSQLTEYRRAAYQYALNHYNLDRYLDSIFENRADMLGVA